MLPNHAPLTIAEQFGTLAAMYPDRIDLGLGRAPGSDQNTMYALRRDPPIGRGVSPGCSGAAGLSDRQQRRAGSRRRSGQGLARPALHPGSSLFGAKLAAALGLPYAFASHFAPAALDAAIAAYRSEFRPSDQLERPYVIAGVNVIAAETTGAAEQQLQGIRRSRAVSLYGRQLGVPDLDCPTSRPTSCSPAEPRPVDEMLTYTALGTQRQVRDYLDGFQRRTAADELMVAHQAPTIEGRLRSVDLLGEAMARTSAGASV